MSQLSERPILIAGGGPVGVITALALARQALPVHVFEAETKINGAPRAATTHTAPVSKKREPPLAIPKLEKKAVNRRVLYLGIYFEELWARRFAQAINP
jgi:flavin-dependent dehydrogenase